MKRFLEILLRFLRPPVPLILILFPLSMAFMIFVFVTGRETAVLGYISHGLSAYTLTALIINMPVIASKTRSFIENHRVRNFVYSTKTGNRLMTDMAFRALIVLYGALFMNTLFAVFKMISGLYYASFWYGADAIFYILISVLQFLMLRYMRNSDSLLKLQEKIGMKKRNALDIEYRQYRFCGGFLFVLNAALTGVVFQIVHQNMGYEYPGLLIYIVAIYAFFCLAFAVVNAIKYRRLNSPLLSAVKAVALAKASVAIFSLQTAMLASFGGDTTAEYKRLFNSLTGGAVCLFIFGLAIYMVIRANRNLKNLQALTKN